MIPKYDFDNSYDRQQTDIDRKVMNKTDAAERAGVVIITDQNRRAGARSSRYGSVEFTDDSARFLEPLEDEDLISGKVKPTVAGYYDTGYSGVPNVYDPSADRTTGIGNINEPKAIDLGKLPKDAYGLPDFFKNPVDLTISIVALSALIIIEIIGLIAVF
ncbi:hypothetical protein SAMN05216413_1103 [Ruminococcaceae bacterium KH2T8]|nr:hypothetical protein SAMN05216413_1103 [Ruminococcaceae bacterium KH2T8]